MDKPKISVIVPIYKVEPYLRRCLDGIVNQTYKNLEIILVDDGSPDNCGAICDEYATKDERIVVIHQENGGVSSARNAGIQSAQGEFFCFIDSDDIIHPEFVATLHSTCCQTDSDIVMCRFATQEGKFELYTSPVREYDPCEISMELCLDATGVLGVVWNKLYAAHLFHEIRFPNGRIHEDEATVYKLYWKSKKCAVIEDVLYYYRTREASIVSSAFSERHMDAAVAYSERIAFFQNHEQPKLADYTKAVYCYFLRKNLRDIWLSIKKPKYWIYEMYTSYFSVIKSPRVTKVKKISLTVLMISPGVYESCKKIWNKYRTRNKDATSRIKN